MEIISWLLPALSRFKSSHWLILMIALLYSWESWTLCCIGCAAISSKVKQTAAQAWAQYKLQAGPCDIGILWPVTPQTISRLMLGPNLTLTSLVRCQRGMSSPFLPVYISWCLWLLWLEPTWNHTPYSDLEDRGHTKPFLWYPTPAHMCILRTLDSEVTCRHTWCPIHTHKTRPTTS